MALKRVHFFGKFQACIIHLRLVACSWQVPNGLLLKYCPFPDFGCGCLLFSGGEPPFHDKLLLSPEARKKTSKKEGEQLGREMISDAFLSLSSSLLKTWDREKEDPDCWIWLKRRKEGSVEKEYRGGSRPIRQALCSLSPALNWGGNTPLWPGRESRASMRAVSQSVRPFGKIAIELPKGNASRERRNNIGWRQDKWREKERPFSLCFFARRHERNVAKKTHSQKSGHSSESCCAHKVSFRQWVIK